MTTSRATARNILFLLFAGYLLSFADRIAFGLVLKSIKATLLLSDSQAGLLAGAAFATSYAVFSPVGGFLVDRFRRKPVFLAAVAFWSVATLGCGLVASTAWMGIARAAVGAGEALLHPLAVSLIGDTQPREARAKAFAIYLSAGSVGAVAVLLFGGALLAALKALPQVVLPVVGTIRPWQGLFLALAVPGACLVALIALVMRDPPRQDMAGEAVASKRSVWAFLRIEPALGVTFLLGFPFLQMAGLSTLNWLFVFFDRVHGWPAGKAGTVVALSCGATFIGGCLLSGHAVAFLRKRGYADAPLRACVIGGLAFTVFGTLSLLMPTPELALAPLAVALGFGYMPTAGAYAAISEAVPPSIRAGLVGINTLTIGVITNSLGPFLVGFLSDNVFTAPAGIRWAMISVMVVSSLLGTALVSGGLAAFRQRVDVRVKTYVPHAQTALR